MHLTERSHARVRAHARTHTHRPKEMTREWYAVEAKGKPRRGEEPWCVWGFATPEMPDAC